jgi:hypothetical protein
MSKKDLRKFVVEDDFEEDADFKVFILNCESLMGIL